MRFFLILLIISTSGCLGGEKANDTKLEKKASEVLKSVLKGETSLEKGGITVSGPDGHSKFTLSASGKKASTGLPKYLEKRFIAPGVKVLSYIQGIDYDTINANLEDSLDAVEIIYSKVLLNAGYQKLESTQRDGLLSAKWIKPEIEARLFLYAYEDGKNSRLHLVFTPML